MIYRLLGYSFFCAGLCMVFMYCHGKSENLRQNEENNLFRTLPITSMDKGFETLLLLKMSEYDIPGISLSLLENGKRIYSKGLGILQSGKPGCVNDESVFSVGSISKIGTAVIILKFVEAGHLDLDTSINNYLAGWKLTDPTSSMDNIVTLRNILSHTAGLNNYGFADYQPNEELPTTLQILEGTYPAKNDQVQVISEVGADYKYSGGGTTILQLLVEEIAQTGFAEAADSILFKPLNLRRSSYANPLPSSFGNIAKAHDHNGKPRALPRGYESMPESAASGLWTTSKDLSKLMLVLMESFHGEESSFLTTDMANQMMTKVPNSPHGLGPEIIGHGKNKVLLHGGSNDSYKARFVGNLYYKNGYAICVNGANGNEFIKDVEKLIFKEMDWNTNLIEKN